MFANYKGNTKHFVFWILIPKQCIKTYSSCSANQIYFVGPQGVARRCSAKKPVLKIRCNFVKKESPTRVLFCELCKIFKNAFFYRTSPVAASIGQRLVLLFVTDHTGRIVFLLLGDYFTRTPVYYFSFTNSQVKFTLSILSGDLFDVSIYRGYYALPCHVLKQTYKKKKAIFKIR